MALWLRNCIFDAIRGALDCDVNKCAGKRKRSKLTCDAKRPALFHKIFEQQNTEDRYILATYAVYKSVL